MEKVVLLTGGTRGLGRSAVEYLKDKGYKVVTCYKERDDKAGEVKGLDIDILKKDVSKIENIQSLVSYVIEKYGRIDCLINNAGIDSEGLIQDVSDDEYRKVMDNNFYSVFAMSREVIPHMLKQKCGLIINISSIYGTNGGAYASLYSSTKGAIIGLTKSLAKELGPSNIRVNSIAPGCMNTDMTRNVSDEGWQILLDKTPLGRKGEGIDIAKCIEFLINDDFVTGQIIRVDGGFEI